MGHQTAVNRRKREGRGMEERGEKGSFLCADVKGLQTMLSIKSGAGKWV